MIGKLDSVVMTEDEYQDHLGEMVEEMRCRNPHAREDQIRAALVGTWQAGATQLEWVKAAEASLD